MDLEKILLPATTMEVNKSPMACRETKKALTVPFLRGPIPMPWLVIAHQQGFAALTVGIYLWHQYFIRKQTVLKIGLNDFGRSFQLSREQARRGIRRLESVGLVKVRHLAGCKSSIELIDDAPNPGIAEANHDSTP